MLRRFVVAGAIAATAAYACARNPVTGKSELSLISEDQEIAMGRQAAQEVAQSVGLYHDQKAQDYVARVGKALAAKSERPNLPWEFHVVDDAAVNAFALPGGFIFVTRGLMTYLNSEAELATVIGHEIGHVTARHSVSQISKAQVAQLGLGLGSILSPTVAKLGGALSQGLGLLFLKYGRDAENQADELGFRYALMQGYDVREMARVFETLDRVSQTSGAGRLPEWLSTHPNPENRVRKTLARVDSVRRDLSGATVDREQYLRVVDGVVFGENPRNGFFRGTTFLHPDLRFQITFPEGWQTQNQPQAVVAVSPNQDAIVQLALAGQASPSEAARQFLSQEGVQPGSGSTSGINGLPAASSYFQAQTQQGTIEGLVTFISYDNRTYGILAYTPAGGLRNYDAVFRRTVSSFGPLKDPAALNVQPSRIELVKVPRAMTIEQFNQQYPSSAPLEQVRILNELNEGDQLRPGQLVKRVVGGVRTQPSN
jgi:predicted Zn-dependent protease